MGQPSNWEQKPFVLDRRAKKAAPEKGLKKEAGKKNEERSNRRRPGHHEKYTKRQSRGVGGEGEKKGR